ncbi:MAG TPA: integrase [Agrobacterium sp.]|nr:integrase [Agrobacterium sp.]
MLVTGLQSTRVCASESLSRPKDLGWLDSCNKQRHEGG